MTNDGNTSMETLTAETVAAGTVAAETVAAGTVAAGTVSARKLTATLRDSGEGETRWFCGGGIMTWKASAAETGGAFMIWEDVMDGGKVTPLHQHPEADETFYLLDGEILLHVDGVERRVGPGGIAILPRGVPHAFMVTSPQAKMLCFQNPAGGQDFYLGASDPMRPGDPAGVVDMERIRSAAMKTGAIEILGPPPFSRPE